MTIIDFSQGYQVPDVYIQQILTQTSAVAAVDTPIVALVGPSRGYLTNTDSVALSTTVPVTLSELGINTASISVVSAQGVSYGAGNYTVVSTAGGTANSNTVTLEIASGSTITPGAVMYVTYQYTDVNYTIPRLFTNYQDVLNAYGQPIDINNNITSPLSLAAQFVFANGGSQVIIAPTVDVTNATRVGLSNAYLNLPNSNNISIVVPLPVGLTGTTGAPGDIINVGSDLSQYCDSLAVNTILRTGFLGYETTSTVLPVTISSSIADARVMNFFPNSLGYYNGLSNQVATIGGFYLAAACAGYLTSQSIQTPLTKKVISGFSGIPSKTLITMTPAYKNSLSSQGVAVLEPNNTSALWIRHGVTTLGTSILTQEISLVRAADAMIQVLHDTLENSGLIGSPSTTNSPSQVQGLVMAVLEQLIADGIIIAYTGLIATLQSSNPTVVAVTYAYSPSYPLNYITVAFTVDTSSGALAAN